MNHWRAAQLIEGTNKGKWNYTCGNRRTGTYAVGYCAGWQVDKWLERAKASQHVAGLTLEELEKLRQDLLPFQEKFHVDGHNTAEEAQACYRLYNLDTHLRLDKPPEGTRPRELHTCEAKHGCKNYTANLGQIVGGGMSLWNLCDDHLNREEVEKLYKVGESWGSY